MMKRLFVFDLDGTLAESKASLEAEMSILLHDLHGIVKVALLMHRMQKCNSANSRLLKRLEA